MMMNRRRHDHRVDLQHGAILLKGAAPAPSKEEGMLSGSTDTLAKAKKEAQKDKRRHKGDETLTKKNKTKSERPEDIVPMVYACATMWHENKTEMTQLMKSIFR